jgi:hypothetical protein
MSAWKVLVKSLYALGRDALASEFEDEAMPLSSVNAGIVDARNLGLIESISRNGRRHTTYRLTWRGRLYAEGRIVEYAGRHPLDRKALRNTSGPQRHRVQRAPAPRGTRFCATWLAAYPGVL